ncbi:glutathione S-transferase family protein [Paraburkholderia sp. Se-20369]|nr:glutathione S-transferase family protein [Paraburkholderia sp. Se-20369]
MSASGLVLFELAGADQAVRFSPHCWKIRMALAHKGLAAQCLPWHFTDKSAIAFSGQECVPVLLDDGVAVSDSWRIAQHLEAHFPRTPPLAGHHGALASCAFANQWADTILLPIIARIVAPDVYRMLDAVDQPYFRSSREDRLGMTFDTLLARRATFQDELTRSLAPLRATLKRQPFLAGTTPNYADYCVFGMFMWIRCVTRLELVAPDDPVSGWRERLLDLFGGIARQAPIHHGRREPS